MKTFFPALLLGAFLSFAGGAPAVAADHGTIIREAIVYLSPDSSSAKLAQAERGREMVLLDRSRNWVHVEAILGFVHLPDAEFAEDEDAERKTVTGWILDAGAVWPSTPNGDRILFGAAADSEDEASRRSWTPWRGPGCTSPLLQGLRHLPCVSAGREALYRAADIKWQVDKADMQSRPSAHEKECYYRQGINEDQMKLVMKKFGGTKWADLAAFHLIDNKLCGEWQGSSKCPDKEADLYEKYAKDHPQSPSAPEALYDAAFRRAALIEIYKTEDQSKKSEKSKDEAIASDSAVNSHSIRRVSGHPGGRCFST